MRKAIVSILLLRGASIGLQLTTFVLIAKLLPLSGLGVMSVSLSTWALARSLGPLGWDQVVLRECSQAHSRDDGDHQSAVLRAATASLALLVMPCLLVAAIASALVTSGIPLFVVGVASIWAAIGIWSSFGRASGRILSSQIADGVSLHAIPTLGLLCFMLLDLSPTLTTVLTLYLIGALFSLGMLGRIALTTIRAGASLDAATRRGLGRSALRIAGAQVFAALASRGTVFLVAIFAPLAAVGLFEAGIRAQLAGFTLAWACGIASAPRYAVNHSEGEHDRNRRLLRAMTLATFVPSALFAGALALGARPILSTVDHDLVPAAGVVAAMAFASALEAPGANAGYYFTMVGRESYLLVTGLAQVILLVALVPPLTICFGVTGAGLAVMCASIGRSLLSVTLLARLNRRTTLTLAVTSPNLRTRQ